MSTLEERQAKLEASIRAAQARGDLAEARRLQREYASSGFVITRYGPAPTVIEGGIRSQDSELPAFYPEIEASYQATLSFEAGQAIRREIRDGMRGLEVGGWLLADPRWPDAIILATGPGDGAIFSRTSVRLNFERVLEVETMFPHLRLRGCWHLHPEGDDIPSATDRLAWLRGRELVGDYYISVIVTQGQGMFAEPKLSGWITTDAFCERLRLREL